MFVEKLEEAKVNLYNIGEARKICRGSVGEDGS
jgi:hypothetical protein